jgi:hypothetical protein
MPISRQQFPVRLTQAQRKVVAEIAPELADRLKLDQRNQRTIPFTLAELKAIKEKAGKALRHANTGMVRNSLRHVTAGMGRGPIRPRRVRSGEGDEGDAEGPAGLEEHDGVVSRHGLAPR